MRARVLASGAFAITLGLVAPARAQLGPNGSPITTNDYAIDTYQGPVLASTRVISLAGAYVAVSEFTEGNTQNPAAPAVRADYSYDEIDYDVGVGVTFPGTITNTDFFNTGKTRTNLPDTTQDGFVFFELSGNLQMGPWGLGVASSVQQYGLESATNSNDKLRVTLAVYDVQLARAFFRGEVVVGLGARLGSTSVFSSNEKSSTSGSILQSFGIAPEFGVLYRPNGENYRLGASFRAPLTSTLENELGTGSVLYPESANPLYLPSQTVSPWELGVGAAYRVGRTFNPEWLDPAQLTASMHNQMAAREAARQGRLERARASLVGTVAERRQALAALMAEATDETARDQAELAALERATRAHLKARFERMNRRYLMISAALFANGQVANAVGVESFFERTVNRSGESVTVSPRLGMESEIVPSWFILRAGTYLEPTRFASNEAGARLHATGGFDLRLGAWNVFGAWPDSYVWRLRASVDLSRDYFNWGLAIGGFY